MDQKTFFKCKHPNSSQEVHCGSTGCKVKEATRVQGQNDGHGLLIHLTGDNSRPLPKVVNVSFQLPLNLFPSLLWD